MRVEHPPSATDVLNHVVAGGVLHVDAFGRAGDLVAMSSAVATMTPAATATTGAS